MNIHEIIHAWETNALPKDIAALAAIQNKVDDYKEKAMRGSLETKSNIVGDMYAGEVFVYSVISSDIDGLTDSLIGAKTEPVASMGDWVDKTSEIVLAKDIKVGDQLVLKYPNGDRTIYPIMGMQFDQDPEDMHDVVVFEVKAKMKFIYRIDEEVSRIADKALAEGGVEP